MSVNKSQAMANIQARANAALAAKVERGQTDLFDDVGPPTPALQSDINPSSVTTAKEVAKVAGKRANLLPIRHMERDFFLCDMFD